MSRKKVNEKQFQRECQGAYLMIKEELEENLSNVDELATALQQAGRNPSRKLLLKYWPSDNSEGINFVQFCDIVKNIKDTSAEQLQNAFRKLDRNRDGYIDFEELKRMLLKKDEKLTGEELRDIFSSADLNKDGKVNYDEFVRLMCETAEETKRQAVARLEKRERKQARQKKRERREQALNNGSVPNGGSVHNKHKQADELSISSDNSTVASTSGAQTDKENSLRQSSASSQNASKKIPDKEQYPHCLKRKGSFFYDVDSEEDSGRADVVSHQYRISFEKRSRIWVTVGPVANPDNKKLETVDTLLLIMDFAGKICAFTENKDNTTYYLQCELPAGDYWFVPFTTGCRFQPRASEISAKAKTDLLTKGKDGLMKLTKEFRMILMNIFDVCDLDDNGTLNREEFNIYNVRTGDEQVTDEEWKVVQENFDKKNGEITIKGFLDLHQLEADDSKGDTEDMWISLNAMGYNNKLQLDEACPFTLEIHSDQPTAEIRVTEIQPVSQRLWENFAKHLLTKSFLFASEKKNLYLHCYSNDYWAALIAENKAPENIQALLSMHGSANFLISPEDATKRGLLFRGASTSILCFLLRNAEDKDWKIEAQLKSV